MPSSLSRTRSAEAVCLAAALWCLAAPVAAQTVDNVLVVVNDASPDSSSIAGAYARARRVATDHVAHLRTPPDEVITRPVYDRDVEGPIATWLTSHSLQDRILYVVLTKGVPLRIAGTTGRQGTSASVDSELTLLYRRLLGQRPAVSGSVTNPYFLGDADVRTRKPFSRTASDIYLVTRLDGFSVEDVERMIERGLDPARDGAVVLDQKGTPDDRLAAAWLGDAAVRVNAVGGPNRALLDTTRTAATRSAPVIGYAGWGSNDPSVTSRRSGFTFVNGAIGMSFVSADARTFHEPPADWTFAPGPGRSAFAGAVQSLAGDLIRDGLTGLAANVSEPYLDGTVRPQVLFPAYLEGANLAEAFYLALPSLSWQAVVVGDPLCAPFRSTDTAPDTLDHGMDEATGLPALFAERRLAWLSRDGLAREALVLSLRAEGAMAAGHRADAEALFVRAADLEPRLIDARLTLASWAEERGDAVQSAARYRQILVVDPQNVTALNNLAFNLADRQHAPNDGLPFAERAYARSPQPVVADTLGWIRHLLGDDAAAAPLIEKAAMAGDNAEILIHAAIVHAALSNKTQARRDLDAALVLQPSLGARADVAALAARLRAPIR